MAKRQYKEEEEEEEEEEESCGIGMASSDCLTIKRTRRKSARRRHLLCQGIE